MREEETIFAFETMDVYKLSKDLVMRVYKITRTFPAEERYALASQLRRAAISVPSNLAEGSGRTGRKDQAHFTQLAYSSLMEVLCQLDLSQNLGFISQEALDSERRAIMQIARMLSRLRAAQSRLPAMP